MNLHSYGEVWSQTKQHQSKNMRYVPDSETKTVQLNLNYKTINFTCTLDWI
jgi:hypothetical protein